MLLFFLRFINDGPTAFLPSLFAGSTVQAGRDQPHNNNRNHRGLGIFLGFAFWCPVAAVAPENWERKKSKLIFDFTTHCARKQHGHADPTEHVFLILYER